MPRMKKEQNQIPTNAEAPKKRRGRPPKAKANPMEAQIGMEDLNIVGKLVNAPEDIDAQAELVNSIVETSTPDDAEFDDTDIPEEDRHVFSGEITVVGKVSGKVAKDCVKVGTTRQGLRALVQQFDSQQMNRIRAENRLRAFEQGADTPYNAGTVNAMRLIVDNERILEKNTLELINAVASHEVVFQYMTSIIGIGPRLASFYMSYIDIYKAPHHSSIDHYCGYNTQNAPTYNDSQIDQILDMILGSRKEITDEDIATIAIRTGRKKEYLYMKGRPYNRETEKYGNFSRTSLHSCLKIPYFNKRMKKLMWLITDQFRRRSGPSSIDPNTGRPKSKYAGIYLDAKNDQRLRNEDKQFAEQAYGILRTTNIKSPEALKWLENGMLTPMHIELRAQRKAGSMFNYDVWGAMHLDAFPNEQLTLPYPIVFNGHSDFLPPEVPYKQFFKEPEGGFWRPLPKEPEMAQVVRPPIEVWTPAKLTEM